VRDAEPTTDEVAFFEDLSKLIPGLHDWYHEDANGSPWMVVSYDFVVNHAIRATLRLDYDGTSLRGGWSRSN
jgi:hypothetical protein